MEKKFFTLEPKENPRLMRLFQIIFGIICILLAIYWVIFNGKSLKVDKTFWITIVFLASSGFYQILAGTGKTDRFIETGPGRIFLKQNSVLPGIALAPSDVKKMELFPMSIVFSLANGKKIIFRFGISDTEIIEQVRNEIISFGRLNGIEAEIKQ